jgi:hypothetical protein
MEVEENIIPDKYLLAFVDDRFLTYLRRSEQATSEIEYLRLTVELDISLYSWAMRCKTGNTKRQIKKADHPSRVIPPDRFDTRSVAIPKSQK